MDDIDAIEKRVNAFRRAHPGTAVSWEALTAARVLPGVPLDPSGTPFVVDPATGRITVSNASKLFPLPGQLSQPQ
jgi:hypothetical protein